jgi:hypothetical protein
VVATAETAWAERVQRAAMAEDTDELRRLFEAGRALFGPDLSRHWAEALSAYDSSAVTG